MTKTFQSGTHPDPESLTAFIELALPAAEREQILAHMARCGRCRQVVYLAQEAAEAELAAHAVPAAVHAAGPRPPLLAGWLSGWRLAWIPAAALAGFVAVAVVQHLRNTPSEMQIARSVPEHAPAAQSAPAEPVGSKGAKVSETHSSPAPLAAKHVVKPTTKLVLTAPTAIPEEQMRSAEAVPAPQIAAGSLHGEANAISAPATPGGPNTAARFGQDKARQQQELSLQQLKATDFTAVGAGKAASAGPSANAVNLTPQAKTKPAAGAPSPIQELGLPASAHGNFSLAMDQVAPARKTKSTLLPNGLTALSVATAQVRMVAIDPSGAMFLSEDAGKHWNPVPCQWAGRAVLVSVRRPAAESTPPALTQGSAFELMNDNLETWVSLDGKTWVPKSSPKN